MVNVGSFVDEAYLARAGRLRSASLYPTAVFVITGHGMIVLQVAVRSQGFLGGLSDLADSRIRRFDSYNGDSRK